jgi:CDP-diacylglycerol--serine O-phosphatidyltransferase
MRLPRLPDLLTTANLSCGVASILLASQGQLTAACWLVFAGAAFDVLDGLAARALGGGSELGKQLDSLADMVTFGIAPATVLWNGYYSYQWKSYLWHVDQGGPPVQLGISWPITVAVFSLVICSAWRLAKFNVDTRQTIGFLGLPTPANALFWSGSVLGATGIATFGGPWSSVVRQGLNSVLTSPPATLSLALVFSFLMLSSIPLPSLKFKHFKWKGNEVIYLLLGIGAVLVLLYGILAVPLILIVYLLSPLWGRIFPKPTEN